MHLDSNFDAVEVSFNAMSLEARIKFCQIGQMYAELYPMPMRLELVKPKIDRNVDLLCEFGELSPAGMCLIDWNTRLIAWTNGAYKKTFKDAVGVESGVGVRIGDLVPEFSAQGLDVLFDTVAVTRQPFAALGYPLQLNGSMTYWDFSLSAFPSNDGANYLFLQLQRVLAPAQSMAA